MPLLALIGYPLAVHLLVATGRPMAAVALLLLASVVFALLGWRATGRLNRLLAFAHLALALAALASLWQQSPWALMLPPLAVYLMLAAVFAAGLRAGAVPLVVRFIRMESESPSPALESLGRRMTAAWVALLLACAMISLWLALGAPLVVWSWFTNVGALALMALLLVAQIVWRRWRFRAEPASLALLARRLRALPAGTLRGWFLPGGGVTR